MPFDPDAEPWLNARVFVAEFGDEAIEEVWRLAQLFEVTGRKAELPKLTAALRVMRAMREPGGSAATIH